MSLLNHMQQVVLRQGANIGYLRLGIVTGANPADSTITVLLQPEGAETAPIPYGTPWVGWYALPSPGQQVAVLCQEGAKNVPIGAFSLYFPTITPPQGTVAGEAILQHSSGSFIKLGNDGSVSINGNVVVNVTAPTINLTASTAINLTAPAINAGSSGGTLMPVLKSDNTPTTAFQAD